ncbi:MAG: hypothetical protein M1462_00360 [Candidatus Thermoplasmatota archaeon]|jgi:hypothetical protein|uniref:hypothetical protein n=1 Tax=Ferroplasma sp. TaxID=2591003 RepID=UPI0026055CB5|nr:hypothetical protein [Ferroplasma sp.]MCL4310870.1 hypothetical protein [Candidatus Thermoplasmatota archaeon]
MDVNIAVEMGLAIPVIVKQIKKYENNHYKLSLELIPKRNDLYNPSQNKTSAMKYILAEKPVKVNENEELQIKVTYVHNGIPVQKGKINITCSQTNNIQVWEINGITDKNGEFVHERLFKAGQFNIVASAKPYNII